MLFFKTHDHWLFKVYEYINILIWALTITNFSYFIFSVIEADCTHKKETKDVQIHTKVFEFLSSLL